MKYYQFWTLQKAKVHNKSSNPPTFKEGEIWWCAIGENIGVEVDGKGASFARPVVVYRKLNRLSFLAIPLTSTIKEGSWYVIFHFNNRLECANLAQIRVTSAKRLYNKIGDTPESEFARVAAGFRGLYVK